MDIQQKTFDIRNPSDYLDKLEWEFEKMMCADEADARELCYHFINFSVTAWHMADWVFPALSISAKEDFGVSSLGDFQALLLRSSSEIKVCREVATAGKHFTINRNPDQSIRTVPVNIQVLERGKDPRVIPFWMLTIDQEIIPIDEVASKSLLYWQCMLESTGLGPK